MQQPLRVDTADEPHPANQQNAIGDPTIGA
jgi:hypothetical protein